MLQKLLHTLSKTYGKCSLECYGLTSQASGNGFSELTLRMCTSSPSAAVRPLRPERNKISPSLGPCRSQGCPLEVRARGPVPRGLGSCWVRVTRAEPSTMIFTYTEAVENEHSSGYCRVDVHIEENREKQEKPLWQVVFIDNKILSKEEQKVLEKPFNLNITPDFSGKMPSKHDSFLLEPFFRDKSFIDIYKKTSLKKDKVTRRSNMLSFNLENRKTKFLVEISKRVLVSALLLLKDCDASNADNECLVDLRGAQLIIYLSCCQFASPVCCTSPSRSQGGPSPASPYSQNSLLGAPERTQQQPGSGPRPVHSFLWVPTPPTSPGSTRTALPILEAALGIGAQRSQHFHMLRGLTGMGDGVHFCCHLDQGHQLEQKSPQMGKTPPGAVSTMRPVHGRKHQITLEKFFLISLLSHMDGGQETRKAVLEADQWNTPGLHLAPSILHRSPPHHHHHKSCLIASSPARLWGDQGLGDRQGLLHNHKPVPTSPLEQESLGHGRLKKDFTVDQARHLPKDDNALDSVDGRLEHLESLAHTGRLLDPLGQLPPVLDEPLLEVLFQLLPELTTDWKILRKDGGSPAVLRNVGSEDTKKFLRSFDYRR
eukprot:bmy_18916T0